MEGILHCVAARSPDLQSCLARLAEGDAVLLMQDAVIHALQGGALDACDAAGSGGVFYVLSPHLVWLGFADARLTDRCTPLDYAGMVELVRRYRHTLNWS